MAASAVRLDVDEQARRAAEIEPALVFDGVAPRLIDEWQVVPAIWNHVRRAIDARRKPGQFILTGSAVPADDVTRHTGAGRLARVRMRPMTLFESGVANGSVSLKTRVFGFGQSPKPKLKPGGPAREPKRLAERGLRRHVPGITHARHQPRRIPASSIRLHARATEPSRSMPRQPDSFTVT